MASLKTAVLLAGGKGTRLASITGNKIPKSMQKILAKPILEWEILELKNQGVENFILITGFLQEEIINYFQNGERLKVKISYIKEESPRGTAGSLYFLKDRVPEDIILGFADTIYSIDIERMFQFHKEKRASITLFTHHSSHMFDSDIVESDDEGKVTNLYKKTDARPKFLANQTNASFFIVNKKFFADIPFAEVLDLEKDLIKKRIKREDVYAYLSPEYIKDAGTVERLEAVGQDLRAGIVEAKCLRNRQKCVFLDRDGTLNKLRGFIKRSEDLELFDDAASFIKKLNSSKFLSVVVSNQPVIARGECSFAEMKRINTKLELLLAREGAYLDDIIYCPHHTDSGFAGEIRNLKRECGCRKPKIGMLLEARDKFNIDLGKSFMIGDSIRDVIAANRSGCKSILICGDEQRQNIYREIEKFTREGFSKEDILPNYKIKRLEDALEIVRDER